MVFLLIGMVADQGRHQKALKFAAIFLPDYAF
jgi:hypothetical protein